MVWGVVWCGMVCDVVCSLTYIDVWLGRCIVWYDVV